MPRPSLRLTPIAVALALALSACGGSPARPAAGPRTLGHTAPGTRVDFSLVLAQPHRPALRRLLRDIHDPASPRYRHFVSPAAFGRRFGLSDRELGRVRRVVQAAGLRVTRGYPQRTALDVRGRAGDVERLFGTRLADRVDRQGQRYRSPVRPVRIPAGLRGRVSSVAGLDTQPVNHPDAVPHEGLKPRAVARAYDVDPLHRRGIRGQGQTVAIVSFDTFDPQDVAAFDREVGITGAPPVEKVPVKGGVSQPGEGEIEVDLDVETIRGIAPRAQILDYEGGNDAGFADVFNQILADRRADVVSLSWSRCDLLNFDIPELGPQRQAEARAVEAMAAAGTSMFSSAGDSGAYHCQRRDPADHRLSVGWPNSSPWAISVGGTLLDIRRNGTYGVESGWEDILSRGGGGGGLSSVERRMPWQRGRGVNNRFSTGRRQVPDVAASGDSESGFFVVSDGHVYRVGGTSASTPFWAGSTLLMRQFAQRRGIRRLGFLAPVLYRVAQRRRDAFHDVVLGGNRYYDAGPGWDYSTGLGTPDVAKLADAIADDLGRRR